MSPTPPYLPSWIAWDAPSDFIPLRFHETCRPARGVPRSSLRRHRTRGRENRSILHRFTAAMASVMAFAARRYEVFPWGANRQHFNRRQVCGLQVPGRKDALSKSTRMVGPMHRERRFPSKGIGGRGVAAKRKGGSAFSERSFRWRMQGSRCSGSGDSGVALFVQLLAAGGRLQDDSARSGNGRPKPPAGEWDNHWPNRRAVGARSDKGRNGRGGSRAAWCRGAEVARATGCPGTQP